jgi:hypothetical protein
MLPQDIVDLIMSHITWDIRDISSCTLVDSAWNQSARGHLFRRIVVDLARIRPSAVLELVGLLPRISQYVRELRFVGYTAKTAEHAEPDRLLLAHIALVAQHVPPAQITTLCIRNCIFLHDYSDPLAQPPNAVAMSILASLRTLRMRDVTFMRSLLLEWYVSTVCAQLQELVLEDLNVYGSQGMGMVVGTLPAVRSRPLTKRRQTWLSISGCKWHICTLELVVRDLLVLYALKNTMRSPDREPALRHVVLRFVLPHIAAFRELLVD